MESDDVRARRFRDAVSALSREHGVYIASQDDGPYLVVCDLAPIVGGYRLDFGGFDWMDGAEGLDNDAFVEGGE
jgi:hypothetical protein